MATAFNNKLYLREQYSAIIKCVKKFDRLYLEIGGRLTYDGHAARVLPGYDPKNKITLLKKLGKQAGLVYCISSKELQKGTKWSDTGLTLDKLAIQETNELAKLGIDTIGVESSQFSGQTKAMALKKRLEKHHKNMFFTKTIKGYPQDMHEIFGKKGFEAQPISDMGKKKIILITGAGANSGKMFFGLSQVYRDNQNGVSSGFAKFETFPIWNLPPHHEVNLAYEAGTADIQDLVMVDKFHKKAYGIDATNYNRDIENFAILKKIISRAVPKTNYMQKYMSPTDMGMNMVGKGIVDDLQVRKASIKEIFRRKQFYEKHLKGHQKIKTQKRMEEIISLIK